MTGRRSRHRRISSWDANLEGRKGVDPCLISPASSGDLTATRSKVQQTTILQIVSAAIACVSVCVCVCVCVPAFPSSSLYT